MASPATSKFNSSASASRRCTDLHGQTESGYRAPPHRAIAVVCASLVRAARAVLRRICASAFLEQRCSREQRVLETTRLAWAFGSPRLRAFASRIGSGSTATGEFRRRPNGFGESTASKGRGRGIVGRYSSAIDRPLHASSIVQSMAMKTFFRIMGGRLERSEREQS